MFILDSYDLSKNDSSDKVINTDSFDDGFIGANIALYDQKAYVRNSIVGNGVEVQSYTNLIS